MNIRLANKFDVKYFIDVATKINDMEFITADKPVQKDHINSLFNAIIHGKGIALIAESEKPIGIIVGLITENLWHPDYLQLNQILFYTDEEWRDTKAGYLLLKKYNEMAKDFLDKNRISTSIIQAAQPLHEIDFSRFGYKMAEKIWQWEH